MSLYTGTGFFFFCRKSILHSDVLFGCSRLRDDNFNLRNSHHSRRRQSVIPISSHARHSSASSSFHLERHHSLDYGSVNRTTTFTPPHPHPINSKKRTLEENPQLSFENPFSSNINSSPSPTLFFSIPPTSTTSTAYHHHLNSNLQLISPKQKLPPHSSSIPPPLSSFLPHPTEDHSTTISSSFFDDTYSPSSNHNDKSQRKLSTTSTTSASSTSSSDQAFSSHNPLDAHQRTFNNQGNPSSMFKFDDPSTIICPRLVDLTTNNNSFHLLDPSTTNTRSLDEPLISSSLGFDWCWSTDSWFLKKVRSFSIPQKTVCFPSSMPLMMSFLFFGSDQTFGGSMFCGGDSFVDISFVCVFFSGFNLPNPAMSPILFIAPLQKRMTESTPPPPGTNLSWLWYTYTHYKDLFSSD